MDAVLDYCQAEFDVKAITDNWLYSILDNNFTDFENTSSILKIDFFDFDTAVQTARFETLRDKLLRFEEHVDDSDIWKELVAKGVSAKKLTVVFWYAVEFALVKNSGVSEVKAGVAAATTYLALCSIKGASAYNIFNQFFYDRCFELFRHLQRCIAFGSRDSTGKVMAGAKKGKGKKKAAVEQHDETQDEEVKLDRGDVMSMLEDITNVFFVFFNKVSLGGYPQIIQPTTNLIRDICAIDASKETRVGVVETRKQFEALSRMSDRAFALFHRLSHEKHSTGGAIVLSRICYPRLSFWGFDLVPVPSSSTIPASLTFWKDIILRFLEKRIRLGIAAELKTIVLKQAFFHVLENLYCRCTDRQDYRTKVSHTIVEVLQLLPREYQFEFIQRVDVFSKNAKNSIRNFSVDIVPLILKSIDLSGADPGPVRDRNGTMTDRTIANKTVKEEPNTSGDEPMEEDDEEERAAANKKKQKKNAPKKKNAAPTFARVEALPSLYESLIRFCVDKSSSVRNRAVVSLTTLLRDPTHRDGILAVGERMVENDKWMFVGKEKKQPVVHNEDGEEVAAEQSEGTLNMTYAEEDIENLVLHIITLALQDKTAGVRKAGLQSLVSFYPSIDKVIEFEKTVALIKKLCLDASVLVRKQAADSLNTILYVDSQFSERIGSVWLEGVLPMINDREQSVVQTATKLIYESVMNPLIRDTTEATWDLLARIEQEDNHRRLLVRALFNLSNEGVISEKIVTVLQQKLLSSPERCDVIWMILAELAVVFKVTPKLALSTWYKIKDGDDSNKVRYVSKVLTAACAQMTPSEKKELAEDLQKKIYEYRVAAPHVSSVYLCLAKVLDGVGEEAPGRLELAGFGVKVLNKCQKEVKSSLEQFTTELDVTDDGSLDVLENRLIRVITTIGEAIQFSPSLVDKCGELVNALKTIMASEQIQQDGVVRERILNSAVPSMGPSQFASRAPSRAAGLLPSRGPSRAGNEHEQGPSQGGSQKTQMSSQPTGPIVPAHFVGCQLFTNVVRAYCVLALGKFCLMDYKRAKEFVPVFVKQLRVNTDYIVRNNIIIVICDLCIRNTQLVDRYSPIIAGCLKDRSTLVRHQTLESLTNLIKEQFIRWEGQIMYRFVSTILDNDARIREYAQFCLKNVLLQQFPDMFYRHFVECLLYFNDISKKHLTAETDDEGVDKSLKFTLSGSRNADARMQLYKFMLNTFEDKEKFCTMAHICEQALTPVLSGEFDFNERKVQDLLKDSFQLMSSKEIKLRLDVASKDDEEEDEPPVPVVAAAKKALSSVFRKGIIQTVMPTLLAMREFLDERRSNLLKDCLLVLRTICIEHREEIEEVLDGDKQLQAEVEFDIRRFEQQLAAEEAEKKRKAEAEAKEARRKRRSELAGTLIHSAIRSAARSAARPGGPASGCNLSPIKMELDEEDEEERTVFQTAIEAPEEQPVSETEGQQMEVEEQLSQIKVEEPSTEENGENALTAVPTASPAKSPLKEKSLKEVINTEPEVPARRRSGRLNKSAEEPAKEPIFAVPVQRKRTRERSVTSELNESTTGMPPRAISTPIKNMPDVSFADLDLSAIRGDETAARPRTSSRRRSGAPRPTMEPIIED